MPVHDLTPSHPKHVWLQRFGCRLMSLSPHLNAVTAAKCAFDAFRDSAELEPEAAADKSCADDRRSDEDTSE